MNNIESVYIVVRVTESRDTIIESVWTTKELAQTAIKYHARDSDTPPSNFYISFRGINKPHVGFETR